MIIDIVTSLIMMAIVQNAFVNTSSSIMISKIQGNIVDVLMPPLSPGELTLAFAAGAARSLGALWSRLRGEETAAKAALRLKLGLKLDTRGWNPELLKQLEWRRFEEVCAAYYEALGFSVQVSGGGTPAGVAMVIRDKDAKTQAMARCRLGLF